MTTNSEDCAAVFEAFTYAAARFPDGTAIQIAAEAFRARHLGVSIAEAISATVSILFDGRSRSCT